jgi:hypothetical protein
MQLFTLSFSRVFGRQDWAAEACFHVYPLYDAIMLYCIDMLLLDPNILRDSILVRMELTVFECYVRCNPNPNPNSNITLNLSLT